MSKMYILVKDSIPMSFAMVGVAHASLACYLDFEGTIAMEDWVHTSFRKVICQVSDEEFEEAKKFPDHKVITESALGGMEIALAFAPRDVWDDQFKKYKLWSKDKCIS